MECSRGSSSSTRYPQHLECLAWDGRRGCMGGVSSGAPAMTRVGGVQLRLCCHEARAAAYVHAQPALEQPRISPPQSYPAVAGRQSATALGCISILLTPACCRSRGTAPPCSAG